MIAGQLEIQLMADVARIRTDMERASRVVDEHSSRMSRAAGLAKSALGAIAGVLSVAAFAGWIKGAIDAADAAGEISARTGVAVKDLAGLQLAFQLGGSSGENLTATMVKLSKSISDGNRGLSAIGVNTTDASGSLRDTKEVLYEVADQFAKMQDGTQKAALAVEIFGKSGAEIIPMLNGGAEGMRQMDEMARKLGLTVSQETSDAAGAFNDNLELLALGSKGVATGIAAELLPVLSSMSGAFLKSMTSGGMLNNITSFLIGTLKVLFSVGLGIAEVFSTVGKVIGGLAAVITNNLAGAVDVLSKVAKGDFTGAWNSVKSTVSTAKTIAVSAANDIGASWMGMGQTISNVFSKEGDVALNEQAKAAKAARDLLAEQEKRDAALKKSQAERDAAAKKAAAEQAATLKSATDYLASLQLEGEQIGKTTDQIKLMTAARAAAKVAGTQLSQQIMSQAEANIEAARVQALKSASEKAAAKIEDDMHAALAATTKGIDDQITAMQRQISIYGKTELEVISLALTEAEAAKAAGGYNEAKLLALDEQIEKLKVLQGLAGKKAELEESKKLVDENLAAQKSMWESIDKTAHDTFISIFDSGKSAFDRLKDTLKNGLLDLLYQMTIKKWIFNIGASVTGGASGIASAADAVSGGGGAGSIGSMIGIGKSIYGAISGGFSGLATTVADTVQGVMYSTGMTTQIASNGAVASGAGAAAGYLGGAAIGVYGGRALSGGYGMFSGSGNTAVNAGTIIGAIVGGPIGAAIGGLIGGAANRLFGMKAKEVTGTTLNGSFGAGGFSGTNDAAWFQKGGIFRSDKSGVDKTAIDSETAKTFTAGYDALKAASVDFAKVLGVNADSIATRTQSMSVALTKDAAANEKAIAAFFTGVGDDIARELVPSLDQFTKAGETASATLQRIATDYATLDGVLTASGMTFKTVGLESVAARESLIDLVGGVEKFATSAGFFQQNFLSEAERLAPVQKQVAEEMAKLGLASVETRDQFKDVVLGLDLTTEKGATTYAALMRVQEAFAMIHPVAEQAAVALSAQHEAQVAFMNGMNRPPAAGAGGGGGGAPTEDSMTRWFYAMVAKREAEDAARLKAAWTDLTSTIYDEVKRIRGLMTGTGFEGLMSAKSSFAIATAQARAGDEAAAKMLPQLSQAMLQLAEVNSATVVDLQLLRANTAASLSETARMGAARAGMSLPGFAVGTNYLPGDMAIIAHEGERIIPAADNRQLMARLNGSDSSAELVAEVRALRAEVTRLREDNSRENVAAIKHAQRSADTLEAAAIGEVPLMTEVAP